ncbi:hypothetical protein DYB32_010509 [Aphanomyces invadans]|uniref:Protein kinase domain-containing protein n=1 Tax=Aphanomyces invadans TaxID=157072 RepID=A0A418AG15_9STRA|nr:hypothetical protein DYB32_010509 [Aphanomyces invadans]
MSQGTYGDVWLATVGTDTVAVKVLRRNHRSTPVVAAFLREIHLLSTLQSPFIVALRGIVYPHPAKLLCVKECLDKGDLRTSLRLNTRLMWAMNAKVALHLASALAYLHDRRIIHRDVKSRNVLLNATFGAKLADFGVATTIKQQRERTGRVVGTYRWMAPEVLRQQPASPASDVYSFGVVLFELDTRQAPFDDHGDADEMAQRILNGDLTLEFSPACPRWVHDIWPCSA